MIDVALEVPLRLFAFGRLLQCHHPCGARVEVLHESLDGATLAGRVSTLEHDQMAGTGASAVLL